MLSNNHRTEHRFTQKSPSPGVVYARLDFTNESSVRRGAVLAPWHEIIVCLGGECIVGRGRLAPRIVSGATVVGLNPGDRYTEEHFAPRSGDLATDGSLVVIGLRDLEAIGMADFVFGEGAIDDEAFVLRLRELIAAERHGDDVSLAMRNLLVDFVVRHGMPIPGDRLFGVKREIDKNPHAPLYVAQLAELASMHPETFTRAFARRFGITPIRYRLQRRLYEAAHLLVTEPHVLVSEVATRVGFEDLRFFHRSFRGLSGVSPAAYRQWFAEGAQGRRRASGIPPKAASSRAGEQAA